MNIPNFITQVKENLIKGDKRYPCYTNRASSLGYFVPELGGCLRRGVYERTHWQEKEAYPPESLIRFKEGNNQEAQVLKDFTEAGIQVIEQQSSFVWEKYQISGHLDGVIVIEGQAIPLEIKSMSPNIFAIMNTFDDFKKKTWTKSYMAQITIYMLMKNIDQGIFILKDKSSGLMKQINVSLDYELGEFCIRAAETINAHVLTKTFPDRIKDIEKCKECPFKLVCLPETNFGEPLKIADDPEMEKRIESYLSLKDKASECDDIYELIRERAKATAENGGLNILVGKYRLTGKKDSRGALRLNIEIAA